MNDQMGIHESKIGMKLTGSYIYIIFLVNGGR